MSIQTTTTHAHLQRKVPKPLRKGGLHSIEATGAIYAHAYQDSTPQPAARQRAAEGRVRELMRSNNGQEAPIRNSTGKGTYTAPELAPCGRPGAMDAYRLPSLYANGRRVWPGERA